MAVVIGHKVGIGLKILKALGIPKEIADNTRCFTLTAAADQLVTANIEYYIQTDQALIVELKQYTLMEVDQEDNECILWREDEE